MKKMFGLIMLITSLIVVAPRVSEAQIYMGKTSAIVAYDGFEGIQGFYKDCIKVMDMGFVPYTAPTHLPGATYIFFYKVKQ